MEAIVLSIPPSSTAPFRLTHIRRHTDTQTIFTFYRTDVGEFVRQSPIVEVFRVDK